MSQSSTSSICSYEEQRILDAAEVKKNHYDLKKTQDDLKKAMGYLPDPKPKKPRAAKQNATKIISEITDRVTRSSAGNSKKASAKSKSPVKKMGKGIFKKIAWI